MMRESHTAVLAAGQYWRGKVSTEPYEAAWAREAIFFLRALKVSGNLRERLHTPGSRPSPEHELRKIRARVQISADGMHWVNEGTEVALPGTAGEVTFCRVRHFGGYLRLVASVPASIDYQIVVSLNLKA